MCNCICIINFMFGVRFGKDSGVYFSTIVGDLGDVLEFFFKHVPANA
jgi:hypothetical protein